MKEKSTWDQIKKPHTDSLYELYHENSKGNSLLMNKKPMIDVDPSDYEKHISLPLPYIKESKLADVSFDENGLVNIEKIEDGNGFSFLSLLLPKIYGYTASQEVSSKRRVVISKDDLFPLEIYIIPYNVEGIEKGVWHYNLTQNKLSLIKYCDVDDLEDNIPNFKSEEPQFVIFITSLMNIARDLQGERVYRNVLIETGKVLQNASLFSKKMDVNFSELTDYNEYKIERILDIDGVSHMLLAGCRIGLKKLNG